jgi:hypothetical protein
LQDGGPVFLSKHTETARQPFAFQVYNPVSQFVAIMGLRAQETPFFGRMTACKPLPALSRQTKIPRAMGQKQRNQLPCNNIRR